MSQKLSAVAVCALLGRCSRLALRLRRRHEHEQRGRRHQHPQAKKTIKVGLVTDIGGLNDRWFNELANKAAWSRAKSDSASTAAS